MIVSSALQPESHSQGVTQGGGWVLPELNTAHLTQSGPHAFYKLASDFNK